MAPEDKDSPGHGQVGQKDLPSRAAVAVVDGRQAASLGPDSPWGCALPCPDTLHLSACRHRGTPDQEGLEAGSGPVVAMDRELQPHGKAQGHREGFYLPNKRRTILLLYRLGYPWRKYEAVDTSRLLRWDTSSQRPTPAAVAICDEPVMPGMNHDLSSNFSNRRTKSREPRSGEEHWLNGNP